MAKFLTVGDLRKALEDVPDDTEIVVRATEEGDDGDVDFCGGLLGAEVQHAHDGTDTPFLALDAGTEQGE